MNRVFLMGRLTGDPELRYTAGSNIPVARFSIAVDRQSKQGEERQADFFRINAWRQSAEFSAKYFKKGMRVLVEGRLQNNNWEDQNGVKHYSMEITADNLHFADGKRDDYSSGGGYSNNGGGGFAPQQNTQQAPAAAPNSGDGFFTLDDDDDDLPF